MEFRLDPLNKNKTTKNYKKNSYKKMSCVTCNDEVEIMNCLQTPGNCNSTEIPDSPPLVTPVFDATLGIPPLFSVVEITNSGSCNAYMFAFQKDQTVVVPATIGDVIATPPPTGLIEVVPPGSTVTITVKDMALLFGICVNDNEPVGECSCSLVVKIVSKFCVPGCSVVCGETSKPKVVENCSTIKGPCAVDGISPTPQTIFNAMIGQTPRLLITEIQNTGGCCANIIVSQPEGTTDPLFPGNTSTANSCTLDSKQSLILVVSNPTRIQVQFCPTSSNADITGSVTAGSPVITNVSSFAKICVGRVIDGSLATIVSFDTCARTITINTPSATDDPNINITFVGPCQGTGCSISAILKSLFCVESCNTPLNLKMKFSVKCPPVHRKCEDKCDSRHMHHIKF